MAAVCLTGWQRPRRFPKLYREPAIRHFEPSAATSHGGHIESPVCHKRFTKGDSVHVAATAFAPPRCSVDGPNRHVTTRTEADLVSHTGISKWVASITSAARTSMAEQYAGSAVQQITRGLMVRGRAYPSRGVPIIERLKDARVIPLGCASLPNLAIRIPGDNAVISSDVGVTLL